MRQHAARGRTRRDLGDGGERERPRHDPSLRANDPHRLFVFRPDTRRGVVLEAVMLLGDVGLSDRGFESELAWGRAQIDDTRAEACSD